MSAHFIFKMANCIRKVVTEMKLTPQVVRCNLFDWRIRLIGGFSGGFLSFGIIFVRELERFFVDARES